MIVVELKTPRPEGGYRRAAVLHVDPEGAWRLEGDPVLDPEIPVPVADDQGRLRPVTYREDPELWAAHLPDALRTGYLVAVVHQDEDGAEQLRPEPA